MAQNGDPHDQSISQSEDCNLCRVLRSGTRQRVFSFFLSLFFFYFFCGLYSLFVSLKVVDFQNYHDSFGSQVSEYESWNSFRISGDHLFAYHRIAYGIQSVIPSAHT